MPPAASQLHSESSQAGPHATAHTPALAPASASAEAAPPPRPSDSLAARAKVFLKARPRLHAQLTLLRASCRGLLRPTSEGRAQAAYFRRYFVREHLGPFARWRCLADFHRCHALFGADKFDYVLFRFRHRSDAEKAGFITDHLRHDYYRRLNRLENKPIFKNKDETYRHFGAFFRREVLFIRDAADWLQLRAFAARHPQFICKPRDAACGQGIRLAQAAEVDTAAKFEALLARYAGGMVVEELIRQAPEMAAFHPSSVNTIRIITLNLGANPVLYNPMLRTGSGGAIVDNGGAGGILAAIDVATGEIVTHGQNREGIVFTHHPDTGVAYRGRRIPRWSELLALAQSLCQIVPTNRYTGWDFALAEHGWVLVEANDRAQFLGHQTVTGRGCRHEFEAILAAHGV
ncbi:MAG TPA: sugar-transfer associated ATP-grasp domain-containing protein [Opitutaceae bacterium]|nr:sugar-transfer associated ATP-grasp domain-containing protein [Opitutaceae bacterium]